MENTLDRPLTGFHTKSQLVYQRLLAALITGEIAAGARVNVDEIARGLVVSKIPIREAVQRLEQQGLVVQTPHSGVRAAALSMRELKGIFLIRSELEGLSARLAAESISDDAMGEIRSVHDGMQSDLTEGRLATMSEHNRQFHVAIARATGYEVLATIVETLLLNVQRYRVRLGVSATEWAKFIREHGEILVAVSQHDPTTAEAAARRHVVGSLDIELKRDAVDRPLDVPTSEQE